MNIQQLKLFSDVVRFGSVNKAAQANYTSPSTLSRSIGKTRPELSCFAAGAMECS